MNPTSYRQGCKTFSTTPSRVSGWETIASSLWDAVAHRSKYNTDLQNELAAGPVSLSHLVLTDIFSGTAIESLRSGILYVGHPLTWHDDEEVMGYWDLEDKTWKDVDDLRQDRLEAFVHFAKYHHRGPAICSRVQEGEEAFYSLLLDGNGRRGVSGGRSARTMLGDEEEEEDKEATMPPEEADEQD